MGLAGYPYLALVGQARQGSPGALSAVGESAMTDRSSLDGSNVGFVEGAGGEVYG